MSYQNAHIRFEPSDTMLKLHAAPRYSVAQITGLDLEQGVTSELLAADHGQSAEYTYEFSRPVLLSIFIDLGTSKLFEQFYRWTGKDSHPEELGRKEMLQAVLSQHPIRFGDIRSMVATASAMTEASVACETWKKCRNGLLLMDEDHPEFEISLNYVMDYLEKFMETLPMVKLQGTDSQKRWAKKLRLRTIQRLGLLHQDHDDIRVQIDTQFSKLIARSMSQSNHWIAANEIIQKDPIEELMSWLLSDVADWI